MVVVGLSWIEALINQGGLRFGLFDGDLGLVRNWDSLNTSLT